MLYESDVKLIKPYDCFKRRYEDLSLKGEIVKSDKRNIRKHEVTFLNEEDILNELELISSSEVMDFAKIHNLMLSSSPLNTEKLRDLLRDYLGNCFFELPKKVCETKAVNCIFRLIRSSVLDSSEYSKSIDTARTNTCLLEDLNINELSGYQLTLKRECSKINVKSVI